eukprot:TRINITY_DN16521_c0_g1_i1.p1 TRINITY_DN16521_c0_g1~~TRINITY_DN16521_c0_g1_i1.p1  ORF type:complete len:290 (-),score=27.23 TRINITY_DN16521_c0_g1_i1:649-1470(-)
MNTTDTTKTSRKTRTKTRKPKYISLRRKISPESVGHVATHQLNLFPLHPENLFEEKDVHDHVAYFFDGDDTISEGGATLDGLLGGASSEDSPSDSLTYAYGGQDSDGTSSLAKAALRQHKERDLSEEKWVSYSEVVESKKEEEVTSLGSCYPAQGGLSLKLDYEEILNAWSDKGSLYIEECPQTVPDHDDTHAQDSANVGNLRNVRLWSVPEDGSSAIEECEGKMGEREARVMRYKEKRQSRLFSKRIRYEVRKLNAEKRPRMKGRFVKRKAD